MSLRSHRHFVAVPLSLLLLLLVLASHPGAAHRSASAMRIHRSDIDRDHPLHAQAATPFVAEPAIRGVLEPGGVLESDGEALVLRRGTAVVRSSGYAQMILSDIVRVHAVRSGWYALRDDTQVLVVALSSPIAVTVGTDAHMLTKGQQLRVSLQEDRPPQRSTVPERWLQDSVTRLAELPEDVVDLVAAIPDVSPLKALRQLVETREYAQALLYVQAPGNAAVLYAPESRAGLLAVIAELGRSRDSGADEIALMLECIRFIQNDAPLDKFLSLSYGIGRIGRSDARVDEMLAGSFRVGDDAAGWATLLTVVERSSSLPLPDTFVARWLELAKRTASADAPAAVQLIGEAAGLPLLFEDRGYPRHARLWEDAVRDATVVLRPLLSPDDRARLDAVLHAAARAALAKPVETVATSSAASQPVSRYTHQELIAMTRQAMQERRAMLTTTTSFVIPANEPDAVRVLGVYFATRDGDLSFDFTYHPLTDTLDRIVHDGHTLPNALQFEQFIASL